VRLSAPRARSAEPIRGLAPDFVQLPHMGETAQISLGGRPCHSRGYRTVWIVGILSEGMVVMLDLSPDQPGA